MYPKSYIDFLVHFHGLRDYFECHEILEEHWKSVPKHEPRHHWVGLIQIAVALYHQRRHNEPGALRMMESALKIIENEHAHIEALGLDSNKLCEQLRNSISDMKNKKTYESFNLPIKDEELLSNCRQKCHEIGCTYGIPSDLQNDFLLHKHTLRDRQEVIDERVAQKNLRKKKREG